MPRTFYTIDDLFQFCKTNNFNHYSAVETGAPLVVQSIETFEVSDGEKDGLLPVDLKSCHIGINRNGSSISEETMNKYSNSFKGRPILASIFKADTGEWEFHSHDVNVDENGDFEYIEQPVGVISQLDEPYLEYDEKEDKTYLRVHGHIFSDYSHATDILNRHKTCKCSVELAVDELSYNAAENYLSIDKFHFTGVTILGYEQDGVTAIEEGMAGSAITIDNFSQANNSYFGKDCQDKLCEILDKLNTTLSKFSINNSEKGGKDMGHFEELLEKYGKAAEDITFEVEGLTDDELDAKFTEAFESEDEEPETVAEPEVAVTEDEESEEDESESQETEAPAEVNESCKPKKKKCSLDEQGNMTVSYEISHDDVRCALYNLLEQYDEADNEYYGIRSVYDDYFVMQGWINGRLYKQGYSVDGDNVALSGERIEVYEMLLTESEKLEVESMRENYAALKQFKVDVETAELNNQKESIFSREEFASIVEDPAFVELHSNMSKFSVDEIESKCKIIFANTAISKMEFAHKDAQKPHKVSLNFSHSDDKAFKPYGDLF